MKRRTGRSSQTSNNKKKCKKENISDDILIGCLIVVNFGLIIARDLLLVEDNDIKLEENALKEKNVPMGINFIENKGK